MKKILKENKEKKGVFGLFKWVINIILTEYLL